MSDELTRCNKPEHWDEPNPCTLCLLTQEDVSNILRLLREKLSIEFWPGLTNLQLHITALRAQLAACQEQVTALEQERGNWKSISETTFAALRKAEEELKGPGGPMNEQDEQRARRTAEEIQLVLEGYLVNQQKHEVANIIAAALAAVREECAKVAEDWPYQSDTAQLKLAAQQIAAAIRGSQKG